MRTESTRTQILDAGRALLAAGQRPTVDEVAASAGISRATVYRIFGGRHELFQALDVELDPGTRTRILEAAVELLGQDGLGRLSMDQLARRAGVSRANLYRLFPGKPALFREVVKTYSPLEPVVELLESMAGSPPSEVMPALARAAAGAFEGRVGLLRAFLFEVSGLAPDAGEAIGWALGAALGPLLGYLLGEMAEGRLRKTHPVLALQGFVGPILFHLLTRDLAVQRLGLELPAEVAVTELADSWLRAMKPDEEGL